MSEPNPLFVDAAANSPIASLAIQLHTELPTLRSDSESSDSEDDQINALSKSRRSSVPASKAVDDAILSFATDPVRPASPVLDAQPRSKLRTPDAKQQLSRVGTATHDHGSEKRRLSIGKAKVTCTPEDGSRSIDTRSHSSADTDGDFDACVQFLGL